MKILILTRKVEGCGLASKMEMLGHESRVYGLSNWFPGEGIFQTSHRLLEGLKWCDFIVAFGDGWSEVYNHAETYNKPILGANPITDVLNSSAIAEFQVAQKVGAAYLESETRENISELFDELVEWQGRSFELFIDRKRFVCENRSWLAWALTQPFSGKILLRPLKYGYKIKVLHFFNGFDWIGQARYLLETDRGLFTLGVNNHMEISSFMLSEAIEPWSKWLKAASYRGAVKFELLVGPEKAEVSAVHCGCDPLELYAYSPSIEQDFGQFLHHVANGLSEVGKIWRKWTVAGEGDLTEPALGAPVTGHSDESLKHTFLVNCNKTETGYNIATNSQKGIVVTARGIDPGEACFRINRTFENIRFPYMVCGSNMMTTTNEFVGKLSKWGYI